MTGLHVLFIDDDSFMLKALLRTARRLKPDWQFYLCEQALLWQDSLPAGLMPDAVFCDFLMPHKNGDAVLEEVEHKYPSTVRILLTGDTAEDVVSLASEVAHFVLSKPFLEDDLNHVFSCLERLNFLEVSSALRDRLGGNRYFEALPEIATKLRQQFSEPEIEIADIAALIAQETAVAAKVIQLANSAFLGYIKHTVSLDEAIKRLGLKLTEAIALSMSIEQNMSRKVSPDIHKRVSEWAVNYANGCRSNSKLLGFNNEMQDMIYVAALMTGVGHLALAAETAIFKLPHLNVDSNISVERATLITVYLLTLWGFSSDLCNIILEQDAPDFTAKHRDIKALSLIMFVTRLKLTDQLNADLATRLKAQINDASMAKLLDLI